MFGNDDLFGDLPSEKISSKKSKPPPIDDDLFGDEPVKPVSKTGPSDDLFNGVISKPSSSIIDDDLFNDEVPKPVSKPAPLSANLFSVKEKTPVIKQNSREDDLFTSLDTPASQNISKYDEDEIVKSKPAPVPVSQDINSIFSDVPDINTETTSSSKKNEEHDLFGSSPVRMKPTETTVRYVHYIVEGPSKKDTIGTAHSVLIKEVSSFQRWL